MAVPDASEKISRLVATGARLRIDAGTAEVVERFERAGARALIVKGRSVARWLYTNGANRTYIDSALLVGPDDFVAAERALSYLGYTSVLGETGMPAWWCEHAAVRLRRGDGRALTWTGS